MAIEDFALSGRLSAFAQSKTKWSDMFYIIGDYIIKPLLAPLIEDSNKIHTVHYSLNDNHAVISTKIYFEREKRPGLLNFFARIFCPWVCGVKIWNNNQVFICEYYKHSFFSICETIKTNYDEKLKSAFIYEFVVVCRA